MSAMSHVWRVARPLQDGSLYVLLFLLPFSKAAVEITFGLLLIGWILERLNPTTRLQTVWLSSDLRPLALSIVAYLSVCALSIAISDFPMHSVQGLIDKWLEYVLFTVIVADISRRSSVVNRGVSLMAWSSLCVAIQAVAQEAFVTRHWTLHPASSYHRMTGPYSNPIDLATYLMVLIPILGGFSMHRRGLRRTGLWMLLLILTACLARTEALGAWMGLWVGLMVVMFQEAKIRRVAWVLLIGSVLACGIFLGRAGHFAKISSMSDIGKVDRLVMWQAAIRMIKDRPILGHGLNTFMANYLRYWVGGERAPRYAHNCYLQVAAETGLVGLVAFVVLLALLFQRLMHTMRRLSRDRKMILSGCVAGLLAFAFQAGLDTNFYSLRQCALFWVLSGMALGLYERDTAPTGDAS